MTKSRGIGKGNWHTGEAAPNWRGDRCGKRAVHMRLAVRFGKASEHSCPCGAQASDWAFDEPAGFSTDLSRYTALCRSCHLTRDGAADRLKMKGRATKGK